MTDGLRKSHLRKAPQVGLSEVGLPDIHHVRVLVSQVPQPTCSRYMSVGEPEWYWWVD